MREIKYRAWDSHLKRMFTPDHTNLNIEWFCKADLAILMQFTGLKDKNGKEIWEGDIVRIKEDQDSPYDQTPIHGIAVVIFDEGMFKTWNDKSVEWRGSMSGWLMPVEVIGNIYENPELVKA